MEIRALGHDDLDAALDVRSRAFGALSSSDRERWETMITLAIDEGRQLAAYDGGRVVAVARIHAFRQWWGGRMLPMAGIGGVAVAPEHRGRGMSATLMRAVLARSAELGNALTALYPATTAPYRAVGYELGGVRLAADLSAEALRQLGSHDRTDVRRAVPADGPAARRTVDDAFAVGRHYGPFTWPDSDWTRDLEDNDVVAYLADDGCIVNGLPVNGRIDVHDIAAASARTTRTLWSLVGSGSGVASTVRATIAPDDAVLWMLPTSAVDVHVLERWMIRLLDPVAAMAGRGFPDGLDIEVPLRLRDPDVPAGNGAFRLQVSHGAGRLQPVDGDAGVRLGPRGLAALFAGVKCATLRATDLASGGDPEHDLLLDAAFQASPWMNGYF